MSANGSRRGADRPPPLEFGFDSDVWLDELREAETQPPLGRLGRFELREEVSRGGQGIVYRADDPRTGRTVALKRLLAGRLATAGTRYRFEREVEAAAGLSHPSIVTIYSTELVRGEPILVMEWIDGLPIDEWAAAGRDPRAAVEVLAEVCDAVHHAHRGGVIHRDLKPSNILVDAAGRPHVLDFGIAKVLGVTDARATRSGLFMGTPAYASPEHVRNRAVDVRSDVYALGVVLYEAVCGRLPYPVDGPLASVFDAIEHAEPARPARVAGIDRELEAILLRTLEKDPDARYQSVEALGRDLRRYLRGEALEARAGSMLYRVGKTVRRRRVPVLIGGIVLALVCGYIVGMPWLYVRAERESANARAVQAFLQETLVASSPFRLGGDLEVPRLLERAVHRVDHELDAAPEVEAMIRWTIAQAYANLWMWADARVQADRAAAMLSTQPERREELAACLNLLGRALAFGKDPSSVQVLRRTLDLRRELYGVEDPLIAETVTSLGFAYWHACDPPRLAEAEAAYADAVAMHRRLQSEPDATWARSVYSYAMFTLNHGDHERGETLFREALDMYAVLPDEGFYTILCLRGLARLLVETDRPGEAVAVLEEAIDRYPSGYVDWTLASLEWTLGTIERGDPRAAAEANLHRRSGLSHACEMFARSVDPARATRLRRWGACLADERDAQKACGEIKAMLTDLEGPVAARWRHAAQQLARE